MAVQAEYPCDVLLPETSWTRRRNLLPGEDKCLLSPAVVNNTTQDFKMQAVAAGGACNQLLPSVPFPGLIHGMTSCGACHAAETELNANMWICNNNSNLTPRKRLRGSVPDQLGNFVSLEGANANALLNMPQSNGDMVSTGLRLSLEDDYTLNSTNGRELTACSSNAYSLNHNLLAEMQRQRNDLEEYMKSQGERVRQILAEKTQKYSRALLCAVAERMSSRLREKDVQVMTMKRRNIELEEKIRGLVVETRAWQNRAKCSEAVARSLRVQIDEKSKEGSGDSEDEAVVSCQFVDGNSMNAIYMENMELEAQKTCRLCKSNDVSILLLPCRHLCLCKDCENKVEVCPVCLYLKTASVQVYLS